MKSFFVPCAVFLTMGLAPNTPAPNPLQRPDVLEIRERAAECQWQANTAGGSRTCSLTQNRELDDALNRYVAEVERLVPEAEASVLRNEHRAWDAQRDHPSRRRGRFGADETSRLNQRYTETLRRFAWVAKQLAAAPAPTPSSPAFAAATATAITAFTPTAPVPAATPPAPETAPASPSTRRSKVRTVPINAPARTSLVPQEMWPPSTDPLRGKEIVRAQLAFTGCLRFRKDTRECQDDLKAKVGKFFDDFFTDHIDSTSGAQRRRIVNDQRQWVARRNSTCEAEASAAPAGGAELTATRCWLRMTRERFGWVMARTP